MKRTSYAIASIIIIVALLTGCAKKAITSKPVEEELKAQQPQEETITPAAEPPQESVKPEEAIPQAEAEKEALQTEAQKEETPAKAAKDINDIFFDYDRFTIRDDAKLILENNAMYLKANKNIKIIIEGHCDERGTSEYNIALSERRAQSAQKYLIDLGIEPSRIFIIGYGKERPFCTEYTDECWQENRRAHFVLK